MSERTSTRLGSLDALRGVAALIVLLHHCHEALPSLDDVQTLHYLFPGSGAVLVFFVLSGLVLGMTFVHRDGDRYAPFLVKRVTRIWPTFAVAVVAAALLSDMLGGHHAPGFTEMIDGPWERPVTLAFLADHLAMTGTATSLDGPIWSLVHEMRISVAFPALVALTLFDWRVALALAAVATLCASAVGEHGPIVASWLMTLRFAVLFVAGIVLALHLGGLRHRVGRAPAVVRGALWVASLALLATSPDMSGSGATTHLLDLRILVHGAGAACVVLLCASEGRAGRWLGTAVPVYLGRISYSLYLWHLIVITACAEILGSTVPTPVALSCGALLSIPVAHLSERWLERPATRAGRALAQRLEALGSDRRRDRAAGAAYTGRRRC